MRYFLGLISIEKRIEQELNVLVKNLSQSYKKVRVQKAILYHAIRGAAAGLK